MLKIKGFESKFFYLLTLAKNKKIWLLICYSLWNLKWLVTQELNFFLGFPHQYKTFLLYNCNVLKL